MLVAGSASQAGGGAAGPPLAGIVGVDEGPMRRDLCRQIGWLERDLTELAIAVAPWEPRRSSSTRGPSVLCTRELEEVRDELLTAIARLSQPA